MFLFLVAFLFTNLVQAQQKTITGSVVDADSGDPLPGVTIAVKGTTRGTITNFDGLYSIDVEKGETLAFSFIGYTPQEFIIDNETSLNIKMAQSVVGLEEVVVIGYGQVKKEDATGSVEAISADDFNAGAITSPQELVSGKIAGVQITSGGGSPGEGSTIRIRGGSSLSASNDPLIVIDGVPVDNDGIDGMKNPLNAIHPSDIETFTVLKDASATAIYGSRASNGVVIITTKKGRKGAPLAVTYNQYFSLSTHSNQIHPLSASEFRSIVNERYANNPNALKLLGNSETDWQDEIYRVAYGHDHNLGLTGNIKDMPFRASIGYSKQEGILKTDGMDRLTGSLGLNPSFFDDHLRVNLNVKGMLINNRFGNRDAIGSAFSFDPTQPVYNDSPYGGYFTWVQQNGDPIPIANMNPVARLALQDDQSTVKRSIGSAEFDYRFHFLPDLRANLNLGYDISNSDGYTLVPEYAPWDYDKQKGGGTDKQYSQDKKNSLLDFYLNYVKEFDGIKSRVDAMAGYSWQHFWRAGQTKNTNAKGDYVHSDTDYETENYLVSFFGRLNYTFNGRYLATFTLRNDGSSRFSPETRWGLFPSVALAWRIIEEPFLTDSRTLSDLKLRLGYGITGQQNISNNDYPYMARYTFGEPTASYQFGDSFISTIRPEGYDADIKWEETTTYNVGLDYGFLNNRISGAIDAYYRVTNDLINFIPVPAGTNLTNMILTNVGDLENRGIEFTINAIPISKENLSWEVGFNASFNDNKITKLTAVDDPSYIGVETGGISGGVGNNIQIHSVGFPANSFFVYEQVYDADGKPIEGLYVDRNGDGAITNDDKYRYKKPAPDVFMGFSSKLYYNSWDFGFSGRVNLNNYVYNNVWSGQATYNNLYNSAGYLNNISNNVFETGFENPKYFSDYYIQDASFLRLDNISLGYTFTNYLDERMKMRLYGTVQNVFVITRYEGLDPEVSEGIDNSVYPRPRTFMLGLSVNF
ncbi:iron complex outermembrane recepter protein [Mariniphaga anaerophila]|uniref:Iron complex outermembrane recepter protein n=2 Tax=Mariniphaga anaerophila TaxID=1484053 RepID=A0A1M5BQF4_9BACT|nr:iron complex outermembrane recepter protein [Mariniphaga anaerophila]